MADVSNAVYLGLWVNWSKGLISGATITTGHQHGFYLVSFLTLFVRMVGGQMWSIIIFVIHQLKSTLELQDGLHHQHQIILRNSQSHTSTLWDLTKIAFFWRKHAKNSIGRTMPLFFLCLFHLALFTAAAFFSSLIASTSDEVLLMRSDRCGYLNASGVTNSFESLVYWRDSRETASWASNYVRDCYQNQLDISTCNMFAKSQIPVDFTQVSCPFEDKICLDASVGALETDTGLINSDVHLGINSRPEDSIDYRRVMTCAPIKSEGYYNYTNATKEDLVGDHFIEFLYGPSLLGENPSNYTFRYDLDSLITAAGGYEVYNNIAAAGKDPKDSSFVPIVELQRDDADVTLVFVVNWAQYTSPVSDLFYKNWLGWLSDNDGLFQNTFPVSVMGCTEQHQICNHGTGECTELMGIHQLGKTRMFKGRQLSIAHHLFTALSNSGLEYQLFNLGVNSLQAESYLQVAERQLSAPLADDMWLSEIKGWANFTGVRLQRMLYNYAVGPSDSSFQKFVIPPEKVDVTAFDVCGEQKIRDSHYYSFSVVGLVVTMVVGCGIVVLNLCLSSVVSTIQKFSGKGLHHREAWQLDHILQVQRMAYENAGMGHWSGKHSLVPVTSKGERFGMPVVNIATPLFSPYSPYAQSQSAMHSTVPLMRPTSQPGGVPAEGGYPFPETGRFDQKGGYTRVNIPGGV